MNAFLTVTYGVATYAFFLATFLVRDRLRRQPAGAEDDRQRGLGPLAEA